MSGNQDDNGKRGNAWDGSPEDWKEWERAFRAYRKHKDELRRAKIERGLRNLPSTVGSSKGEDDKGWIYSKKIAAEHKVKDETLFGLFAAEAATEVCNTVTSKHKDYGASGINGAPGGALNGLLVRLHDKLARANNLTKEKEAPNHESLRDTFLDIAGYGIIGLMVLDEKFPKE
jgi:hypothetical protein